MKLIQIIARQKKYLQLQNEIIDRYFFHNFDFVEKFL